MAGIFLSIVVGLAALFVGAGLIAWSGIALLQRFGLTSGKTSLAVAALGMSLPAAAAAINAVLADAPGMAVGTIVGANIANCLLAVGLAATMGPVVVPESLIRREGSALTFVTLLFVAWGTSFSLDVASGLAMLALFGLYLALALGEASRRGPAEEATRSAPFAPDRCSLPLAGAAAIGAAGLALLGYGGRAFVEGGILLSHALGVSHSVVGLTVVALATTIPQLAASTIAAQRRQAGLALGNAIGACLFSLLGIGGVISLIGPVAIPASVARFDFPVLVAATLLVLVLASTGRRIARPEGIALVACYAVYLYALFR